MQRLGDGESRVVTVRFSVEDYAVVQKAASVAGETVSEYVRASLVNFGIKHHAPEKVNLGPRLPIVRAEKPAKGKVKRDDNGYCRHGMMGRCARCEAV